LKPSTRDQHVINSSSFVDVSVRWDDYDEVVRGSPILTWFLFVRNML